MLFKLGKSKGDQVAKPKDSFVSRLARSISVIRQRKSKTKTRSSSCNSNERQKRIASVSSRYDDHDNISNCSSIELVRQLQSNQSRASSGTALMGRLNVVPLEHFQKVRSHFHLEPGTMCDNCSEPGDLATQDQCLPPSVALATVSNFDDDQRHKERILAKRRADYARRNIGALRQIGEDGAKDGTHQAEWLFKLYNLRGIGGEEADKEQDAEDVAKSIHKTLVTSLTPLIASTTTALRQFATQQNQPTNDQQDAGESAASSTEPPTVHLHITMKPELIIPTPPPSHNDSHSRQIDSMSPASNNTDAMCVVRVSAKVSNEDQNPVSPIEDKAETEEIPKLVEPKPYTKNLTKIDDIMLQSMPAELFDNRALMKPTPRHLVDCAVQTGGSNPLLTSICASNACNGDDELSEQDPSPAYFQQQILKRHDRRISQKVPIRDNVRRARVVSLHKNKRQVAGDDFELLSETSIVGTYEERICSVAKCLDWLSKPNNEIDSAAPPPVPHSSPMKCHIHNKPNKRQPAESVSSPQVAIGAGESLAIMPCSCNRQRVFEHHHIHHHKHFLARI